MTILSYTYKALGKAYDFDLQRTSHIEGGRIKKLSPPVGGSCELQPRVVKQPTGMLSGKCEGFKVRYSDHILWCCRYIVTYTQAPVLIRSFSEPCNSDPFFIACHPTAFPARALY